VANVVLEQAQVKEQSIKALCFDPFNARDLMQDFAREKYGSEFSYSKENVLEISQTPINLALATQKLRNLIIEEQLIWNGENKLLKWCFMNCYTVTFTRGAIIDGTKVKKETPDSPRNIDLVAAIITAMHQLDRLENNNYYSLTQLLIEMEKTDIANKKKQEQEESEE
ncbi:MAG: terminase large subunit, partial [Firmicutes bacterium]|nr:terminase large subunit [Bacillota bacterium]